MKNYCFLHFLPQVTVVRGSRIGRPHISILKFASVASGAGGAKTFVAASPRKHRYLPHRSRWALEMAARARSGPQERSKWLLEPARSRSGARNGRSSPPRSRWGARNRCSSPPRSRWGARNGRSSPVGVAGALEMAARAPSASLGRSKWPHEPARLHRGGRNRCSGPLGFAEALTLAARVRSASLGRSKWPLELARLRWGGRNRCSGLLGRPRWGARQRCSSFMRKSYSKTLCSGRDSLWTPGSVRLSSEHGYARVRASISIHKVPFVSRALACVLQLLRPNSLGLAGALGMAARTRSASLMRSH